MSEIGSLV